MNFQTRRLIPVLVGLVVLVRNSSALPASERCKTGNNVPWLIQNGSWVCALKVDGDLDLTGVSLDSVRIDSVTVTGQIQFGSLSSCIFGDIVARGDVSFQSVYNSTIGDVSATAVNFFDSVSNSSIGNIVSSSRDIVFLANVTNVVAGNLNAFQEINFFKYVESSTFGDLSCSLYDIYFFRRLSNSAIGNVRAKMRFLMFGIVRSTTIASITAGSEVRMYYRRIQKSSIGPIQARLLIGFRIVTGSLIGDLTANLVFFGDKVGTSSFGNIQATDFGWDSSTSFPAKSLRSNNCRKFSLDALMLEGPRLTCPRQA
mmetsp:Transcript_18654/g.39214  ORF Transcript_18654/g.39214 Transcript_18654/m.39214 type:complete len:314 (-) Transcript_18654:120-1061(-)|eukprot:CAMPEP_0184682748 /NCGR_PEP_ID=MMETSP0312-20130426/8588_1 /TAXON_ID=31354 /ORGANISM="Compsopogon coeruleus, Strain SAG 36.94" /LENGTH=313 /DNA_ID=CAMNT_0027134613 /DNA_START=64 /DNA_END=1005 /DNA_ORIENTATION=+